jgi:cullin-4
MKTRKRSSHTDLMGEVLAQVRFPVLPADVKKRVESLIEREYLERDENDSSMYNYLA